jgi:uncharacterized protein YjbI with pentapeptide repeats
VQRLKRSFKPKLLPFTDEQIRDRAYALWQAQPERSAEEHWQAAIEALQRERSPFWKIKRLLRLAFTAETPSAALDVVKVMISAFGVLATFLAGLGLYLTYRTGQAQLEAAQEERQLNNEKLVTDRSAKAVEHLGSKEIDVRIGAILSLERIANDSPKDYRTVMEVLTAFVRNRSSKDKKLKLIPTDVQSALTVIGRRKVTNHPEEQKLNLTNTDLNRADLQGANLSSANLSNTKLNNADLQGANLSSANLSSANLSSANLSNANLSSANLSSVTLFNANLSAANLYRADLNRANLGYANLFNANLNGADLYRADLFFASLHSANLFSASLYGANLLSAYLYGANFQNANLRSTIGTATAQIKEARYWRQANYDTDTLKQLGLLPEKPNR